MYACMYVPKGNLRIRSEKDVRKTENSHSENKYANVRVSN